MINNKYYIYNTIHITIKMNNIDEDECTLGNH